MNTVTGIVTLVSIIILLMLLGASWLRGRKQRGSLDWLLATITFALLACATYLVPEDTRIVEKIGRGFVLMLMLIGMFTSFGMFIIHDTLVSKEEQSKWLRRWLGVSGLWLIGVVLGGLLADQTHIGQVEWLTQTFSDPTIDAIAGLVGIAVSAIVLIGFALYQYYQARLPEVANRALIWVLTAAILNLSILLLSSSNNFMAIIGMVAILTGISTTTYAFLVHRVFDIRNGLIMALRTLSFIGIATAIIFATLYIALSAGYDPSDPTELIIIGAIALFVSTLYIPLRQIVDFIIQQITIRRIRC